MPHFIVTYTSMVIEADNADDAIARAEDQGGGHWEAEEQVGSPEDDQLARDWYERHFSANAAAWSELPDATKAVYLSEARWEQSKKKGTD